MKAGLLGALVALGSLTGCAQQPYFIYRAGILTADTDEGRACRRECLSAIGGCSNYWARTRDGATATVYIQAGPYSQRHGCPALISDCLATCPGAKEDPAAPPAMIYVDGWGRRWGDPIKPDPDADWEEEDEEQEWAD